MRAILAFLFNLRAYPVNSLAARAQALFWAVVLVAILGAVGAFGDEYMGLQGHWVRAVATAYSPEDDVDSAYRAKKGADLYMTAGRVSDVRLVPYGVAAPNHGPLGLPLRTRVVVRPGSGYAAEGRILIVDDTGGVIRRRTRETGELHIDLRVKTQLEARQYGKHTVDVFVVNAR